MSDKRFLKQGLTENLIDSEMEKIKEDLAVHIVETDLNPKEETVDM